MKYQATRTWRDLTDGHLYREGDPFPFDGREIAPERIAELENARNRAGFVLIQAKNAPKDAEPEPEEAPETVPEPEPEEKKPARKTATKKTAAKKTAKE